MKATLAPSTGVQSVTASDHVRSNRLTQIAVERVNAYLQGEHGTVREVTNPRLLAEFAAASPIGHSSVGGPIRLGTGPTQVHLATVKVVNGMLMLQGQIPSTGGEVRTFYCGQANRIFA